MRTLLTISPKVEFYTNSLFFSFNLSNHGGVFFVFFRIVFVIFMEASFNVFVKSNEVNKLFK